VRRQQSYPAAVFRDAVKLGDERHHVRHMLGDVVRDDQIKFVIGKRVRHDAQIMNHVRPRARIIVEPDRAFIFIRPAADIEYFH